MTERYLPPSEFLNYVVANEITFDDTAAGQANLAQLLGLVADDDRANRDWAAFLIAGLPFDSPDIRAALIVAANDTDVDTRDEAIVGLARRDRTAGLELLRPLLDEEIGKVLLEAAAILGDRSLVPALRAMEQWEGGDDNTREQLRLAIIACEEGQGIDHAGSDLVRQHRLSDCPDRTTADHPFSDISAAKAHAESGPATSAPLSVIRCPLCHFQLRTFCSDPSFKVLSAGPVGKTRRGEKLGPLERQRSSTALPAPARAIALAPPPTVT